MIKNAQPQKELPTDELALHSPDAMPAPMAEIDRFDSNPLFDTVSDQYSDSAFVDDEGTMVAGNVMRQVFTKGLKEAGEAVPAIVDTTLEMGAEARARRSEFLQRHEIDIEMPDKAVNINLEYLDAPDKVNQTIVDIARMMPEKVEAARGGVQTWDQTKKLAQELNLTPEELLNRKQGEAWKAQDIYAARMMLAQARDDIDMLSEKINNRQATPEDLVDFRHMMGVYAGIQQQIHGLAAEAGRALNQFKIAAQAGDIRNRQIDALLDQYGSANTERMAHLWSALDDPKQKAKFARDANAASTMDMVLEYWINALLSAPSTHAVNIMGNSLTMLWTLGERTAARGISMVLRDDAIAPSEVTAQLWGLYRGSLDGLRLAWQTLKTGEPTDPQTKMEAKQHRAISKENVGDVVDRGVKAGGKAANWMLRRDVISPEDIELSGWIGRGVDALGAVVRTPGTLLMAEDEFFKSVAYRMELNALAARDAFQQGLSGKEAAEYIGAVLDNPPPDMHIASMDAAQYKTFTDKLGAEAKLQQWMTERPVLRFIMPFVRTPLNITAFSFERIPGLNLLIKRSRDELFSGDPARRDIALGKLMMGSLFMAGTMPFVSEHFDNPDSPFEITGAAPSDAGLRSIWRRNHQEYSIRVNDEWYAYNRMDPLGQILGIMADSVRIMRNADEATLEEYSVAIVHAISNNLINKTYMQGVADFFEVFTSFDDQKWQRFVKRYAASFIPNVARRLETQIDPTVRLTDNIREEFCARVVGCSADLPPMRNLWGEPIETQALGWEFVSPIFNMQQKYSAIDKEMERLKYPVRMPRRILMGVELTNQQYSDYVLLQGKTMVFGKGTQYMDIAIGGLNMKDALSKLVTKSNMYREGSDSLDPPGTKAKAIRGLAELYRAEAQFHLMRKYPELLDGAIARKTKEYEANGLSPFDAATMGIEYANTLRSDVLTNLESRVKEE